MTTNTPNVAVAPPFFQTLGESLTQAPFWVGFTVVILFAVNRFSISNESDAQDNPPLVARSFTTRFRYSLSAAAYVACFEFLFIMLVGIGSFPLLQGLLKELIGSSQVTGGEAGPIGTPAWAAIVATSVLPSVPVFRPVDEKIRTFLHRFASIPRKAHDLSQEVRAQLQDLPAEPDEPTVSKAFTKEDQHLFRQSRWFMNAFESLQNNASNQHNASAYRHFFGEYIASFREITARHRLFIDELKSDSDSVPLVTQELAAAVERMALYLCCALLKVEPSEREVRNRLREQLGLESLRKLDFGVSFKQITLAFLAVIPVTFLTGLLAVPIADFFISSHDYEFSAEIAGFIAGWVPYAALMLIPPFILASGFQLYLNDLSASRNTEHVEFEDKALGVLALLLAAGFLGIVPPLAGMAMKGEPLADEWILQIIPFGMCPAALAVSFFFVVTHTFTSSRWLNGAIDFVIFGSVGAFTIWLATFIATENELTFPPDEFDKEMALIVFPITAAVLVGILGALQCTISRARL